MRIIVTGGNGYVGRVVARKLYWQHDIIVVDNMRYGRMRFDPVEYDRYKFEKVDIVDFSSLQRVICEFRPDTIIHLAAIHYIPECEAIPSDAVSTNVVGTVNLLNLCPTQCRFVLASSAAVYAPDSRPHTEELSALGPNDVYGWSKLHSEQFTHYFAELRRFPAVIIRLFNVIGPGETNHHLLPEIIAQLKAGRRVVSLGNLTPKRDYIHVEDAANGFIKTALCGEIAPGNVEIVNLGTGFQYSVAEILDKIRIVSGIDFTITHDPTRIRKADRPHLVANNERVRRIFGWKPQFDIDSAIADLWMEPDLSEYLIEKYRS